MQLPFSLETYADRLRRVRARMEGGHADYRISRDSFVRALLVQ